MKAFQCISIKRVFNATLIGQHRIQTFTFYATFYCHGVMTLTEKCKISFHRFEVVLSNASITDWKRQMEHTMAVQYFFIIISK